MVLARRSGLAHYVRVHRIGLIHTHYYHYHTVSGLAYPLCGARCLWHWHGQGYQRPLFILGPFIRQLTSDFAWCVAISQTTAQSIARLCGENVAVIYNGIVVPDEGHRRVKLREMLGLPEHTRIVGTVGMVLPIKGHLDWLQAAAQLCPKYTDVHFVAIGGPTEYNRAYFDRVLRFRDELGLEKRVHFLGYREDAADLSSDFDIKTVCTLPPGEGFGLVIIEAMARGVPVIATDVGAPRELISHNRTGLLVKPGNPTELARAIEDLLSDGAASPANRSGRKG